MKAALPRTRPVRVVMLVRHYPPDYSGSGQQAERLARALSRAGVGVRVLTTASAGRSATGIGAGDGQVGPSVVRFRTPRAPRALDLWLGARAALWLTLHRDWEILHLHGFAYFAVLPVLVARARRRAVLVKTTLLGGDDPQAKGRGLLGRAVLAAYRASNAVVALSASLEEALERDGHFRGRVRAIPNGVDTQRFRPPAPSGSGERAAERARLGLPDEAFAVIAAGELGWRKNTAGLARAMARVRTRPLCLVLVGPAASSAPERNEVERALEQIPDDVSVHRLGTVDGDDMPRVLRACDAFVLASRAEGMPNALLEAMATGLACIATDVAGSRDVLVPGTGERVPPENTEALATAIERVATDAALRERLSANARRHAERVYSLSAVAASYAELYRTLRDEGGGAAHG